MGVENLKRQGTSSILDLLGLGYGDPIYVNLAIIEGAADKNEKLIPLANHLASYIGVKARYY